MLVLIENKATYINDKLTIDLSSRTQPAVMSEIKDGIEINP